MSVEILVIFVKVFVLTCATKWHNQKRIKANLTQKFSCKNIQQKIYQK